MGPVFARRFALNPRGGFARRLAHGLAAVLVAAGCSRSTPEEHRSKAPADRAAVLADTALDAGLTPAGEERLAPPVLTVLRIALPAPGTGVPPPEAPAAEPPVAAGALERLPLDERLRPPILRSGEPMSLGRDARGWVELDVRVDERGDVTQVRVAGGDADSATVQAALRSARTLHYYPAQRAGEAVAVWCRQRFEVPRR